MLAAQNGEIIFEKAYGYNDYSLNQNVAEQSIYDLASVTKVCATSLAIMKLYEEHKLSLEDSIGRYLPFLQNNNKKIIQIKNLLIHEAGLQAFIPFYKETLEPNGSLKPGLYRTEQVDSFNLTVTSSLYLRHDWPDTMLLRIDQSPVGKTGKYLYSDLDFILLGKIVESITGMSLDKYVYKTFYRPLGLKSTGFSAYDNFNADRLVPTEMDNYFRQGLLRGYVHDPAAAMFGGVSGHAGLFSSANDLAVLLQMLLNKGSYGNQRFFADSTVDRFTGYNSTTSRRGYGFDKPEEKISNRDGYPSKYASTASFGHTGYTGTCVWVDPARNLLFIFLSNRIHPMVNNRLQNLKIRENILDAVYEAISVASD